MTSAAHTSLAGRTQALVIESRVDAGRAVLVPRGELIHGSADVLAKALAELPDGIGRLELDMTEVRFMDTAGLEFLETLGDYGHLHGIPVMTANWDGQPRRILELVGLDTADPVRPADGGSAPEPPHPPAPSAVAVERAEQLRHLQQEVDQLRQAIASRPVIDQARGILMATHACTSDEAWTILREASQLSNTKLRTVAAAVTASTGTDGPPPPEELRTALRTAVARRWHGAAGDGSGRP
ncbi:ANTAR domain-containing protein [Streptomyces sp. NBC_01373]|uniref:ANTAR domain-containing protein n=1 Tax=Streptomyces sp. NBC_01373 TaxID=2903843 RepID=UPI00225B489A|nr:ANTAR domain-containing protein [Streptomyces sp. NBC_01373]MCX4701009.1 ANTAR domain-containing protein [Streptomyces sp. NBC_01373]